MPKWLRNDLLYSPHPSSAEVRFGSWPILHRAWVSGAHAALPACGHALIVLSARLMSSEAKHLVKQSAGLVDPGTFFTRMSPRLTLSCTQSNLVSRWRTRPTPVRFQIPSAAEASVPTSTAQVSARKSCTMLRMHRPSAAARTIATSSASALDRATVA